ncbi:MAG: isochorismatase family protein [Hyphomicrobiales bacterium]|nr:MAG: isochorismatase family protein [Hyphomicrobiales bacterium]
MTDLRPLGCAPPATWQVSAAEAVLVRPERLSRPLTIAAEPKPVTLDLARTALIVIDMQNDFCHPDGWLASIGVDVSPARAPIAPLQAFIPKLRAVGVPIVWANWGARPDRMNLSPALLHVYNNSGRGVGLGDPLPGSGARVLTEGSWSAAVIDELRPEAGDIQVSKHRMSGFWDTPLDQILRNLGLTTLLFAGVNADQCVLHTLADANFLGYDTLLVTDCSATTSPPFCWDATLYNVRQIFGFTTTSLSFAL